MDWNAKVQNARSHIWELTPLIFIINRGLGKRGRRNCVYSQQRTIRHHYVTNVKKENAILNCYGMQYFKKKYSGIKATTQNC